MRQYHALLCGSRLHSDHPRADAGLRLTRRRSHRLGDLHLDPGHRGATSPTSEHIQGGDSTEHGRHSRTTMNRTPRVMAFAAVCLTLGVPAIAGTLNSPMMFADNNGQERVLFCSAVNVGTGPIAHVA